MFYHTDNKLHILLYVSSSVCYKFINDWTEPPGDFETLFDVNSNWGTENDPDCKYHNGNSEPKGFGEYTTFLLHSVAGRNNFKESHSYDLYRSQPQSLSQFWKHVSIRGIDFQVTIQKFLISLSVYWHLFRLLDEERHCESDNTPQGHAYSLNSCISDYTSIHISEKSKAINPMI